MSDFNVVAQLHLRAPKNIPNIVNDIRRQLKGVSVKVDVDTKSLSVLQDKLSQISATLKQTNTSTAFSKVSQNTQAATASLVDLDSQAKKIAESTKAASRLAGNLGIDVSKGFSKASSSIRSATTELVNFNSQAQKIALVNLQAKRLAGNLGIDTSKPVKNLKNLEVAGRKAGTSIAKNMKVAGDSMQDFGAKTALAFKRYAAFLVGAGQLTAFVFALREGISQAIEFEGEMIKVAQVSGRSIQEISSLSDTVSSLSINLGVSSNELIKLSRVLKQTGLSTRDTEIALEAIAKSDLAPTFESMGKTAEGVISIMRQFDIPASRMEEKLAKINLLSSKFAVESGDLITAVRRAGGVFQATGGSLEDLLATFTAIRSTTREGAESIATGLRTIFTRITRKGTLDQLDLLGVKLKDSENRFIGPVKAIQVLSKALRGLRAEGGAAADVRFFEIAELLGGFRQITKIIPLLTRTEKIQKALALIQDDNINLDKERDAALKGLGNQITRLNQRFLKFIRSLTTESTGFRKIIGVMLDLGDAAINVADSFSKSGLLPILASIGAFKGGKALLGFGKGLFGGGKAPQPELTANTTATQQNTTAIQSMKVSVDAATTARKVTPISQRSLSEQLGGFSGPATPKKAGQQGARLTVGQLGLRKFKDSVKNASTSLKNTAIQVKKNWGETAPISQGFTNAVTGAAVGVGILSNIIVARSKAEGEELENVKDLNKAITTAVGIVIGLNFVIPPVVAGLTKLASAAFGASSSFATGVSKLGTTLSVVGVGFAALAGRIAFLNAKVDRAIEGGRAPEATAARAEANLIPNLLKDFGKSSVLFGEGRGFNPFETAERGAQEAAKSVARDIAERRGVERASEFGESVTKLGKGTDKEQQEAFKQTSVDLRRLLINFRQVGRDAVKERRAEDKGEDVGSESRDAFKRLKNVVAENEAGLREFALTISRRSKSFEEALKTKELKEVIETMNGLGISSKDAKEALEAQDQADRDLTKVTLDLTEGLLKAKNELDFFKDFGDAVKSVGDNLRDAGVQRQTILSTAGGGLPTATVKSFTDSIFSKVSEGITVNFEELRGKANLVGQATGVAGLGERAVGLAAAQANVGKLLIKSLESPLDKDPREAFRLSLEAIKEIGPELRKTLTDRLRGRLAGESGAPGQISKLVRGIANAGDLLKKEDFAILEVTNNVAKELDGISQEFLNSLSAISKISLQIAGEQTKLSSLRFKQAETIRKFDPFERAGSPAALRNAREADLGRLPGKIKAVTLQEKFLEARGKPLGADPARVGQEIRETRDAIEANRRLASDPAAIVAAIKKETSQVGPVSPEQQFKFRNKLDQRFDELGKTSAKLATNLDLMRAGSQELTDAQRALSDETKKRLGGVNIIRKLLTTDDPIEKQKIKQDVLNARALQTGAKDLQDLFTGAAKERALGVLGALGGADQVQDVIKRASIKEGFAPETLKTFFEKSKGEKVQEDRIVAAQEIMVKAQEQHIKNLEAIRQKAATDLNLQIEQVGVSVSKGVIEALQRRDEAQGVGADQMGAAAAALNTAADKLAQIPTEFQINGNHQVIVKIQGGQAIAAMQDSMKELVISATNAQISKFARHLQDGRNPVDAAGVA